MKKIGDRLYCMTKEVIINENTCIEYFRIDGRDGNYRVDRLGMLGCVWEAIDGGEGFEDLKDAERYLADWIVKANEQQTFFPKE